MTGLSSGWLVPTFVAFLVSLVGTRLLIHRLSAWGVLDRPNARSSHHRATPRGGGVAIVIAIATAAILALLLNAPLPAHGFWGGVALIAIMGWADDSAEALPVWARLLLQIVAAALALLGTGGLTRIPLPAPADTLLGPLSWPVALLWIVGVTNFYNFLDGIDGYAAAQAVIAGAVFASMADVDPVLGIGAAVAGAAVGFGVYNWHPARIFMGDVGSATLGFIFATLPFHAHSLPAGKLVFLTALTLWFFLADGVYTMARRAAQRERVWEPHRTHLYQRLVQTGLSHDRVTLRIMVPAAVIAVVGVAAFRGGGPKHGWAALGLAVILFLALVLYTRRKEQGAP